MKWSIPFLFLSSLGWANSVGPIFPSTCSNYAFSGGVNWVNPSSGTVEDGNNATDTSATSNFLYCSGYNFSGIPANATITGITFGVKKVVVTNVIVDASVRLFVAGSPSGNDKFDGSTPWPTPLAYVNYGSNSDLWGLTLGASDVQNVLFGAGIAAVKVNGGGSSYGIDAEQLTVYFTPITAIYKGTIQNGTIR